MLRVLALLTILMLLVPGAASVADEQMHLLQRGETLYSLARRYGVTVDELVAHNRIADPTKLAVGVRISIPGTYVVQQGEYIVSIARKLGVSWLELLAANGLGRDDVVRPGDVLRIPGGVSAPQAAAAGPPASQAAPVPGGSGAVGSASPVAAGDDVAGGLLWPHPGARTSFDGKFPGVAIAGQSGDAFRSVTAGVVKFVAPFSSFGQLILVQGQNGYLYGYAGAEQVQVRPGDRVEIGTVLGSVGISPALEGSKVLFTVWWNNRYIDPETAPRG